MNLRYLTLIALASVSLSSCSDRSSQSEDNSNDIDNLSGSIEVTASEASVPARVVWPPASNELENDLLMQNYLVILDDSGSMQGQRIEQARSALLTLAKTLPKQHNLGLILLNEKKQIELAVNNREAFTNLVKTVKANGHTPLKQSTKNGFKLITKQASKQKGYGDYHVIIVTDGESSDGSPISVVKSIVRQTAVQIHVVGFHLKNHELNNPEFVDYQTANNSAELIKAFEAVAAETNQFSAPKEFSN